MALDRTRPAGPCVVCGETALRPLLEKGGQRYCQCASCGHIAMDPLPELADQAEFYRQQYAQGEYRGYLEARPLKLQTFERRLDAIASYVPAPGRVLDVGCSSGAFVEAARARGLDAWGAEQVESAVQAAPAAVRPFLLVKDVERDELEGRYGLITFFDVIEHMRDPRRFLLRMKSLLAPGGYLALTCPDRGHVLRFLMGARWPHYQPFQHFHLFGKGDLRRFLEASGFQVLDQRPVRKVLTYDYLADQLGANNGVLSRAMRTAGRVLPSPLRRLPLPVPIGEMMAIARSAP